MAYDKLLIADLETTGLDPRIHEIIEIGAICCDATTLEIEWQFETKVWPEHIERAEPKALEVNGFTAAEWKDAPPLNVAVDRFCSQLDHTMILTGQNVWFDYQFYRVAIEGLGFVDRLDPTPYGYSYHKLDITSMAFPFQKQPVFRMSELAPIFGVQPEPKPHRAMNGVRIDYELLKETRRRGAEWRSAQPHSTPLQ